MGSQHRRPDLHGAIGAVIAQRQADAEAAAAPERAEREARLDRDAALYGSAGWEALPAARRAMAARHVAAKAEQEAA